MTPSTAGVFVSPSGFPSLGTDRGITDVAQQVPLQIAAIVEAIVETERGRWVQAGRVALSEALSECSVPNWDGYGAAPASRLSAQWARKVLDELAPTGSAPDVAFNPQGDVVFEWRPHPRKALAISIGGNGEVRWSSRIAGKKSTGIDTFDDELPEELADLARSFTSSRNG